jgi:hypothetical protein
VSARGTTGAITTDGEVIVSSVEVDTLAEVALATMADAPVMAAPATAAQVFDQAVDIMAEDHVPA